MLTPEHILTPLYCKNTTVVEMVMVYMESVTVVDFVREKNEKKMIGHVAIADGRK